MRKHVAIFSPQAVKAVFTGKKTIESRFSQKKIPPFGHISVGDLVYIKPAGKEIKGQFLVKKVISFEGLDETDWEVIKKQYKKKLILGTKEETEKFLEGHAKAKYGTIMFIGRVEQFIVSPVKFSKKDLRGWIVL